MLQDLLLILKINKRTYIAHRGKCPLIKLLGATVKNQKSSFFLVPFLLLATPFAFISKLFENRIELSRVEVQSILDRMRSNEPDENLWDDFLSVPIKDNFLDMIREKVEVLWAYDEYLTKSASGQYILNQKGLDELANIIQELRFGRT